MLNLYKNKKLDIIEEKREVCVMQKYKLKHKDETVGLLNYDETTGRIVDYKDFGTGHSPFLGAADASKIKKWWEIRSVPASRKTMINLINQSNCFNNGDYLAKNLALSLTDLYWICPVEVKISFDKITLFNITAFSDKKIPLHNIESYDPNASLGGQMEKYWDMSGNIPVLVKESYKHFGQQAINEVFATKLHELQETDIPYVKYTATKTEDNGILCRCKSFTTKNMEFISAYEIVESSKKRNDISMYDYYIDICTKNGIDKEIMQNFMDYQTLTDFVISNTDEHLNNFGALRDMNTMKLIAPAPIFDSGNSMFFADTQKTPYSKTDILKRKITGFCSSEEKMLKFVKNKNIVKEDLLPDKEFVMSIYSAAGIPEWKANIISDNYMIKRQMLKEFQIGHIISMYQEKQKEKQKTNRNMSFVMLCGISETERRKKVQEICEEWGKTGINFIDANELYSIEQAMKDTSIIMDEEKTLEKLPIIMRNKTYTIISTNDTKEELDKYGIEYTDELVSFVVDIRIRQALRSHISIIHDAPNLNKKNRVHYVNMAKETGVDNRRIYFANHISESIASEVSSEELIRLKHILQNNTPSEEEGWTDIQYFENDKTKSIERDIDDISR